MSSAASLDRRVIQARLIYNTAAGGTAGLAVDGLLPMLAESGISVRYDPTQTEADLDAALSDPSQLVIAVGGDGTVRAVATRMVGRDVPIAVIPAGTANNIAVALGVYGRSPQEIIAGLAQPIRRMMDIGVARGPWGQQYFVESAGCGLFADLLFTYSQEGGRSLLRALATLGQVLPGYSGAPARVTVDGVELSGSYLLVEALNSPYIAMRVPLAPEADIGDGQLDVVLVADDARAGLLTYVPPAIRGTLAELPNATVVRGRRVRLEWEGSAAHVDDALCLPPQTPGDGAWLDMEVLAAAQEVWVPYPLVVESDPKRSPGATARNAVG